MNTTTKLTFGLFAALSLSALAGCDAPLSLDEMGGDAAELDPAEVTGEVEQALEPDAPEAAGYFRLRFKHCNLTTPATECCIEPVEGATGAPLVLRQCNAGAPAKNDTQSFVLWNPSGDTSKRMLGYAKSTPAGQSAPALCVHMAGYNFVSGLGGKDDGVAAVLYQCDVGRNNQWFSRDTDLDDYRGIYAAHSSRYLYVMGSLTNNNAAIYQFGMHTATSSPAPAGRIMLDLGGGVPGTW